MSDFDKEAERKRLREKYEKDRQKREATERMSELLLKGATMTNKHCEVCGDPIFRWEGQEFCPTCRAEGRESPTTEAAGEATAEASGEMAEQTTDETADQTSNGSERDGAVAEGSTEGATATEADAGDPPTAASASQPSPDGDGEAGEATTAERAAADREPTRTGASEPGIEARRTTGNVPTTPDAGVAHGASGGLDAARASLIRALARHAERAETTEDPRRAREHLAAAHEAAEALAALDRR